MAGSVCSCREHHDSSLLFVGEMIGASARPRMRVHLSLGDKPRSKSAHESQGVVFGKIPLAGGIMQIANSRVSNHSAAEKRLQESFDDAASLCALDPLCSSVSWW